MRTTTALPLGLALAHAITIAALHWPDGWLGLLALLCWAFAAVGAGEPMPTRSLRHADVRAAEETALGQLLMHREGWLIERPALALGLLALLSLLAATLVVTQTAVAQTQQDIALVYLWSPALLLAAGFILSTMVNMWLVTGPIIAFWLLGVIFSVIERQWPILLRLVAGAAAVVVALFCLDLLRGARRGRERTRSQGTARP